MEKFLKELFVHQEFDETNFFLIAGPCVIESEALIFEVAEKVRAICKKLKIPYISNHLTAKQTGRVFLPLPGSAMKLH